MSKVSFKSAKIVSLNVIIYIQSSTGFPLETTHTCLCCVAVLYGADNPVLSSVVLCWLQVKCVTHCVEQFSDAEEAALRQRQLLAVKPLKSENGQTSGEKSYVATR